MSPPSSGTIAHLYRAVWKQAEGRRHVFVGFIALLLVAQLIRLLIPYFFGQAVNALQANGAQDLPRAGAYMGLIVVVAVLAWVLHGPGRVLERFTALAMRERFADALYAQAIGQPLAWHEQHHSGETIHRMGKSTDALYNFAQTQFVYLQNAVNLVGPLVALAVLSPATGGAALVGYGIVVVLLRRMDRTMVRLARAQNRAERRYSATLVDCLGNAATVTTLRLQQATRGLVRERLGAVAAPVRRSIVVNEVKWAVVDLLNTALRSGIAVLYAYLAYRATGSVHVGTACMVYQYSQQIGNVVGAMAQHWADLVRHQTDVSAADAILEAPSPRTERALGDRGWREIRVDALTFEHARSRSSRPTLDEVSIVLRRGERVALVGETGSGKSSLLRVLAGIHDARSGSIRVDGEHRSDLRDLAILVPQDPEVFETTLAHNITLGIEHSTHAVARACDAALLTPVIASLPRGLSTRVAERGRTLSGGQKQRLALARGLLAAKGASLVMLDEPTSSLDPMTEATIYENLFAELKDACVVSAVHRFHLLPRFDVVVLFEGGRVVDAGTCDELLARQPSFAAMWRAQTGDASGHHPIVRSA